MLPDALLSIDIPQDNSIFEEFQQNHRMSYKIFQGWVCNFLYLIIDNTQN